MRVALQGFVIGDIWKAFDDILFTGRGGKANMSWEARNIPPIGAGSLPKEVWVRDPSNHLYAKLAEYDPNIVTSTPGIYRLFRIAAVYDGLVRIYNPEIKVYEKPYFFSLHGGETDHLDVPLSNEKFIRYTNIGDTLEIRGNFYTILSVSNFDTFRRYYLDSVIDLQPGEFILNISDRFDTSDAEAIFPYDITRSPYRFKWGQNTEGFLAPSDSRVISLPNTDKTTVIDLYGDDRIAVFSDWEDFSPDIGLSDNITASQTTIRVSSTIGISPGDYLTIFQNESTYEIVYVERVLSGSDLQVKRGELGTTSKDFTAGVDIFRAKYEYFSLVLWPPTDPGSRVKVLMHVRIETSYL